MISWLKQLFSESGAASMSRTISALVALAGIVWVSYLVAKNRVLPDLAGLTIFVGTPYGLGKLGSAIAGAVRKEKDV